MEYGNGYQNSGRGGFGGGVRGTCYNCIGPFLTAPFLAGRGFHLCGLLADSNVGNEPGHQVRGLRFVGDGATQMVREREPVWIFFISH